MHTTTHTTPGHSIKRADAVSLWVFMAAGAAIALWVTWSAVARIIEVLPNRDVAVLAPFAGTPAEAPIGTDGAPVTVELEQAVLTVPELPIASVWAIVIQQAVLVLAVVAVVTALIWLSRNVARGVVFCRTNTVLVSTAGIVALLAYFAVPFFGNMASNGAFAVLSEHTFNNVIMTLDPFALVLAAFVVALMSTVFAIGERLQRDTEGLV
ncbi:hypothetical protein LQ757_04770 [Agromyces sp. SYSU K20354]|uniref:hypothetical protein n=1 Tax=Agromyces cavernae TaxID=2898659 RepID=UPI001E4F3602|nr:hypothetical protein [Agromyces cavernae]MCD2441585.1 hypothetical protein [Agromyces cavernae]